MGSTRIIGACRAYEQTSAFQLLGGIRVGGRNGGGRQARSHLFFFRVNDVSAPFWSLGTWSKQLRPKKHFLAPIRAVQKKVGARYFGALVRGRTRTAVWK